MPLSAGVRRADPQYHSASGSGRKGTISLDKRTVVCFGDSVTQGVPHVPPGDTFPAVLERRLNQHLNIRAAPVVVVNAGAGGENTAEGLARFDTDVAAHNPCLVIVEFGLNDLRPEPGKLIERDDFAANLHRIYGRCRELGADVVFTTPNPVIDRLHGSWGTGAYDQYGGCNGAVSAYAEVVRTAAYNSSATLCDIYAAFVEIAIEKQFRGECYNYGDLTCLADYISRNDGVHPTIAGQEVIAQELYKVILLYELL